MRQRLDPSYAEAVKLKNRGEFPDVSLEDLAATIRSNRG